MPPISKNKIAATKSFVRNEKEDSGAFDSSMVKR